MDVSARQNVAVLGATGSIGKATCEVLRHLGEPYRAWGLTAHQDVQSLLELADFMSPAELVVSGGLFSGEKRNKPSNSAAFAEDISSKEGFLARSKGRMSEGPEAINILNNR